MPCCLFLGLRRPKRTESARQGRFLPESWDKSKDLNNDACSVWTGPESGPDILPDEPLNSVPQIAEIAAVPRINIENDVITLEGSFSDRDLDDVHIVSVNVG